jgi:hypothetical protein
MTLKIPSTTPLQGWTLSTDYRAVLLAISCPLPTIDNLNEKPILNKGYLTNYQSLN